MNHIISGEVLAIFEQERARKASRKALQRPRSPGASDRRQQHRARQVTPVEAVPAPPGLPMTPTQAAEAIRLYYIHHMSFTDIADHALHVPISAIAAVIQESSVEQAQAMAAPSGALLGGLLGVLTL